MTLHQLIDYISMEHNVPKCDGFLNMELPWNKRNRHFEVIISSLKNVYRQDSWFGYYCNLSYQEGDYHLNVFDDAVKVKEFSDDYIPAGKPKTWKFNSISAIHSGIGLGYMINQLPLGVGAPYALKKGVDVTALYVDVWSWCSLISEGMVERLHKLFSKIDSISDEVWSIYYNDVITAFVKDLKKIIYHFLILYILCHNLCLALFLL